MKASDFVKKYSLRLVEESDLNVYQDFIKHNFMSTNIFNINLMRTESLMRSFDEQGIKGFPVFLIDDQKQVCGLFSLGIRQAFLNGKKVSYGYLSDLRLSTKKMSRTLIEFRKIYRDILENANQIEEFKEISFFLTSVLGDNLDALKALGRGRSGVVYKHIESFKTQALWVHPGYILPTPKTFQVVLEDFEDNLKNSSEGLSEDVQNIARITAGKVKVMYQNKVVFSGLLAKPSLRKLELGFNVWDKVRTSLAMNWLLQVEIDSELTTEEYQLCIKSLIKKLIAAKKIEWGSYLLFKTETSKPSMLFGKEMVSQIFQVGSVQQNLEILDQQKIQLESFFL
ncbi:MAG: hypothetical protein ACKOX6_01050 [Bdellovibrio sp.]